MPNKWMKLLNVWFDNTEAVFGGHGRDDTLREFEKALCMVH